ncbi:bifunctional chorismate mutase T and prephenate dehydrogenase [Escherichia coli]|uniref:chorismate mutase n=1 Tax=Escherichia coli TaxID=562 RepID=A0A377BWH1_ECOLX|nr:bifunctional chorismate mutase T and prephenate dehydrogenase [Escherichia coli]
MVAELTALRDQIDEVDKALLNLLAKRLELVAEVGEVKSRFGLPIYVPEREASMLASRRAEAEALGVPPDLIEDVLRRVMRESYSSENDKGFKTLLSVTASGGYRRRWRSDGTPVREDADPLGLSGADSGAT